MAYLGEDIKKLGFGLMRLPKLGDSIDIEQTKQMVDAFLDAGFTYFDTAWAYEGSEDAIRQALVERYPREKFQLATKLAAWLGCKTAEEAKDQFRTSLERTGAGYFDYYLLHNLGQSRTEVFEKFDIWDFALELKREGLIKHLGFSFHDKADVLEKILQKHPEAEFVQLQINYADWEDSGVQSRACYETARKYNKPIIIMEPVKGGMLANPPESIQKVFKDADPDASVASWAVKFAADLDGVITVLSGMSTLAQMQDNLSYMKDFKGLSEDEKDTVKRVQEELAKFPLIPCTSCDYCRKICPMGIGISPSFSAMNMYIIYNDKEFAQGKYEWNVKRQGLRTAGECIGCGMCETVCPQHIRIRRQLVKVSALFDD